jgi:hypothetical protein
VSTTPDPSGISEERLGVDLMRGYPHRHDDTWPAEVWEVLRALGPEHKDTVFWLMKEHSSRAIEHNILVDEYNDRRRSVERAEEQFGDLKRRLERASDALADMVAEQSDPIRRLTLAGRVEGVNLALSYLREYQ